MSENKKPDESKELKRLLDAHIEVAKARLGRAPSLEDLQKMITVTHEASANQTPVASEKPQSGEPKQEVKSPEGATTELSEGLQKDEEKEPSILSMKVYYGLGTGVFPADAEKKPDPNKVLFYETADGRAYDTNDNKWCDQRPAVLDHLPCRPIQFNERDIVAAIAHGVMEDGDFDALDKAQMISETPRKLWSLKKRLMSQVEELEKSQVAEIEEPEEEIDTDLLPGEDPHKGDNFISKFKEFAGVSDYQIDANEQELPGDDVLSQIIQAATAEALTGMEEMIRAIVRDELGMSQSSESMDPSSFTHIDDSMIEEPLDDQIED
jgi:hypothetical protein